MNDTKTQKGALVKCDESNPTHEHLKARPVVWGVVAITQTLLTSGLIFGWASLLPIIRKSETNYTPEQYSLIFTAGAIGNYTSTLVFGIIMDNTRDSNADPAFSKSISIEDGWNRCILYVCSSCGLRRWNGCICCIQNDLRMDIIVGVDFLFVVHCYSILVSFYSNFCLAKRNFGNSFPP